MTQEQEQVVSDSLREFINKCKGVDNYREIEGADWDLEIGALTEATMELIPEPPLLIFDKIKGYPAGFRVASLLLSSTKRSALALGLSPDKTKLELVRLAARKVREATRIPPLVVSNGPVMENSFTGDRVDVLRFPSPRFRPGDGGRYIGTGDIMIVQDPGGHMNMATCRMQVHEPTLVGVWMSSGQHSLQICQKYWSRGESCPVVAAFGVDPLTFLASSIKVPWGQSELEFAGGLRKRPLEVIKGPETGLPIPANAEIAIEGEIPPPSTLSRPEGPFGEFHGYYAGGTMETGEPQPVIRVKAVYHRNDPILHERSPMWPGAYPDALRIEPGLIWDQLEKNGVQDVVGVYAHTLFFVVVSIRQRFPGHAKQAGLSAASCSAVRSHGRYIVVVDDDIDPTNIKEVLWAMMTRVDPSNDIEIVDGCWSTPNDPRMAPSKRSAGDYTMGRSIICAVRPFHWKGEFPQVSRSPTDLRRKAIEKFRSVVPFPPM